MQPTLRPVRRPTAGESDLSWHRCRPGATRSSGVSGSPVPRWASPTHHGTAADGPPSRRGATIEGQRIARLLMTRTVAAAGPPAGRRRDPEPHSPLTRPGARCARARDVADRRTPRRPRCSAPWVFRARSLRSLGARGGRGPEGGGDVLSRALSHIRERNESF